MLSSNGSTKISLSESQADKFRAAARRIGADEDEARWVERLKKVTKAKLVERPE
jgi:hypothetical protein